MFRFEEDAFLRKGGEYSRNCLAFDEEEELAMKLQEAKPLKPCEAFPKLPSAKFVFISAGGNSTESLVRSLVKAPSGWISIESVGQLGELNTTTMRNKQRILTSLAS